jgi:hypothetical protein
MFWVLGLISKETAAMFPFVLFAMDYVVRLKPDTTEEASPDSPVVSGSSRTWHRFKRLYLPMIAIAVTAGIGRLLVLRFEYPDRVAIHWNYVLVELDVLRRYIWLLIRPAGQTLFHAVPAIDGLLELRALMALITAGLIVCLVWRLRATAGVASFGIIWFLLGLAPSSVLAVLDQGEPMAEHRVYLASGGFFLAAAAGISHADAWLQRAGSRIRRAGSAMMAVVLMSLSALTLLRNAVWADPIAVWRESVDLAPAHYRPRLLLGEALQDKGRRAEALEEYRTAIRLRPTDIDGYLKLSLCLADMGRFEEARQTLRQALEVDPTNEPARRALAMLEKFSTPS